MGWLDIMLLVIWGLLAMWGWKRGLIGLAIPLLMAAVGLALSSRLAGPVGKLFSGVSDNETFQTGLAFLALFVGFFVLSVVIGSFLRSLVGSVPFGERVDRVGGILVGLVVGFALLSGLLVGLQKYPITENSGEAIAGSPVASFMANNFDAVVRGIKLIPGDWDNRVKDALPGS